MEYTDFLRRMVELCEKAYKKNRIAIQTERSFFESCLEVEKKQNQALTLGQFLQFKVDFLVDKEKEKQQEEEEKEKDRNKGQARGLGFRV